LAAAQADYLLLILQLLMPTGLVTMQQQDQVWAAPAAVAGRRGCKAWTLLLSSLAMSK